MLEPNQIFAHRYRILRHLADGGMGVIFEAEHVATEARVALKVLWPHIMAHSRERFELEARVSARVNNEHIVRVYDAGFDEPTKLAYLVMELLIGSTLTAQVRSDGPMSPRLAGALMRQVARGVDAAHSYRTPGGALQPIVHRDLKPDNLFLCSRGRDVPLVKLLDFGIAKVLRESARVTQGLQGTPAFMAYEQLSGEKISPRTDVWALGLITYFALTGRSYWHAANSATAELQTLFAEILTLPLSRASARMREDALDIELPPEFDSWLFGCIARDPARRFASPGEAVDALERALEGAAEADPSAHRAFALSRPSGSAQPFTRGAYATTALPLSSGALPLSNTAHSPAHQSSHSVSGIASERTHAGRRRPLSLVGAIGIGISLLGAALYFLPSARRALSSGASEELPTMTNGWDPAPELADDDAPPSIQAVAGKDPTDAGAPPRRIGTTSVGKASAPAAGLATARPTTREPRVTARPEGGVKRRARSATHARTVPPRSALPDPPSQTDPEPPPDPAAPVDPPAEATPLTPAPEECTFDPYTGRCATR